MRPLRLELKGFTAFRDPASIDFTELDVFAISGPTGSGKSSLLDAMTYALFGRVERVGASVGQLVSQGQPRMAVTLEFEVGMERYRVTRSTPAKGATKILLERQAPGGEWAQAGEGADLVKGAEAMIVRAVGLTYDGFTRSVLLPQGKFHEFLVGDPTKRRDILTQLLGLTLFKRMAERAGSIGKEAADRARWTADLLDREFGDVTPGALKEAKAAAQEAKKRERALAAAAEHVVGILGRWEQVKRSTGELEGCARDAARAAAETRQVAEELAAAVERLELADTEHRDRVRGRADAEKTLQRHRAAHVKAIATQGSAKDLAQARLRAQSLADGTAQLAATNEQLGRGRTDAARLHEARDAAEAAAAQRAEALAARQADLARASTSLKEAEHLDLVAAASQGLKRGDDCPVCGRPLERAPARADSRALDRATKAVAKARQAEEAAEAALAQAERALDAARMDVASNAADQKRLEREMEAARTRTAGARGALESVLGRPVPSDPAAAIDRRLEALEELDRAERDAQTALAEAEQAVLRAENERTAAQAKLDRLRDRLGTDRRPLLDRAAKAVGKDVTPVTLPAPPAAGRPAAVLVYADKLGAALEAFGERLAREVEARSTVEAEMLAEAAAKVGGLVEPAGTLEALAEAVDAACRAATAQVATAGQRAQDIAERLARKKVLATEAEALDARGVLFKQLALELRADRLIAFLQIEALQVLAAAGSERLSALSEGRYRIVCDQDEFRVVDTWNGDEERSVRTLSGGETFLASLSLALALSDQVRSLSVTDRARLDSLFLDEGFGTLDPETLRVVVDAIEQLTGDGRLVGVITHVPDLAEHFPRIEVEKSPRGSRLKLVPA